MRYYPLLLDLHHKNCLVVGAGTVGTRKIRTLLKASPKHLLVLDTAPFSTKLTRLAARHPELVLENRTFSANDLDQKHLVFACTSNRTLNAAIARGCQQRNILCNIIDDPQAGDVVLPSIIQRGDLLVTVSTSGKSPALCRTLRQELDCRFGEEYEILLDLLGRIRQAMLPLGQDSDDNAECFRSLVNSSLLAAIREKDTDEIRTILARLLPKELHPSIGALTHDLFPSL
ncbi:precorrin-2 dehydrogenase/sirohydrochlorin ferrochelatase family protein [Desulfoplanes formicivorans]|uniref:precorrin-2 dehydrogenase n=1 Tax=Desulfoplanes formicivorans TaxID=1592317 RepID=A0A194AJS3_9BACT|nr:bifunctional precorrin-2 dehydrogenase/sirohydrochlorin ferrochelatase [Desulfoplanes formicivorans]GAU08979.1 siroheme synthase [Desulfoplanes formicivorans]